MNMAGRVRLKDDSCAVRMDEDLPTLLEIVFKYLANNLSVVCHKDHTGQFILNEGVIIPNEICDRLVIFLFVI